MRISDWSSDVCSSDLHDDRDDRAHRNLARVEQIETADDEREARKLLAERREVDRGGAGAATHRLRSRAGIDPLEPLAEHLALGGAALERFGRAARPAEQRALAAPVGRTGARGSHNEPPEGNTRDVKTPV